MILKLLGLGGGGNSVAAKAMRVAGRRKASRVFSFVIWPLLFATFFLTRVIIHGQALVMNIRLLSSRLLFRSQSSGVSLRGALACYGVATGSIICYLNYRLIRRLLRVDGAALVKSWIASYQR